MLERMRHTISGEHDLGILEQLVFDEIADRVILLVENVGASVRLTRVSRDFHSFLAFEN